MSEASRASNLAYHPQEHGQHYSDYKQPYRAPAALAPPNGDVGRNGHSIQPSTQTMSPSSVSTQHVFDDARARSRKGSHVNAIAPSFQIPRSVNDSGGSLSELAAQITCLFWFESADILQLVDESQTPQLLNRQLVGDAKPTTGFRKWVTTILSTTMVAQNVVLLALLFIYRLKKLNPTVAGKPGSEYRLLTVALMLGNKFLDDNTYTNKTWAEVSGILVGEVHIMEVEFLSNMKYCLFTSAKQWAEWQALLGKFAAFVERSSKPQTLAPILPPASSLYFPLALPSPPASNQASPPYTSEVARVSSVQAVLNHYGPTPVPSPLAVVSHAPGEYRATRKRSREDDSTEPPPKRLASGCQNYGSSTDHTNPMVESSQTQHMPRLTLPSLAVQTSIAPASNFAQLPFHGQLPPLNVPARAMAMVFPNPSTHAQVPHLPAPLGRSPYSQLPPQHQPRLKGSYPGSAVGSPASSKPTSTTALHPPAQISPTYVFQQRNSPYRPVHNVSTLLYPPSSAALQQRARNVEQDQMHYQPLAKPSQEQQSGRLPYVAQNVWLDGNQQHPMTPVHQWPSFLSARPQHPLSLR